MIKPNLHYADLKESYLFYNIAQKINEYLEKNPGGYCHIPASYFSMKKNGSDK